MNSLTSIDASDGRQFREHPTAIDKWTVTVDGEEAGTIERDGNRFTPRCGRPYPPRSFSAALDLIAEVFRHRKACEAQFDGLSAKEAKIARLEEQKACFAIGAASHMDVAARSAEIDRRIALVPGL